MIERFYTCELLTDVVLNASLATEGNMQSLDYISGSNFYGIVAASVYCNKDINDKDKKRLLHSDQLSFGDGIISDGNSIFYSMPYMYYKEKDNDKGEIHLHHRIEGNKEYDGIQFKQERNGFVNKMGQYIKKVKKNFQLKSAYDRDTRSSKDEAMFGFEAIQSGQTFVFSVMYRNQSDSKIVEEALIGTKYIGKSKTAQYGKVEILSKDIKPVETFENDQFALVYAESNLCFFDENGMPTYEPTVEQLGFDNGRIVWEKSQIRTYTYSPWNGKRATNTMQRNCIAKGSVFYIDNPVKNERITRFVGEHVNEGLGRVIINPSFLENEGDKLKTRLEEFKVDTSAQTEKASSDSLLFRRLKSIRNEKQNAIDIAKKVNETLINLPHSFRKIPSSQWGAIRAHATIAKNIGVLKDVLFDKEKGYLNKGVAYERYWGKSGNIRKLEKIISDDEKLGLTYIIKLCAEIAKMVNAKNIKGQR